MDPTAVSFASAAAGLVSKGECDTVDALCALSTVQRAFEREVHRLEQRAAGLASAAPRPAARLPPPEPEPHGGFTVGRRTLPLLWLLLAGCSSLAFALGFWSGRHAG
ncbi:MAG: hypothetical protein HY858_10790 [Candidatus Solibacter usitatus]|nr:hypothetical protein [Candidatus Solibacter usitatus]